MRKEVILDTSKGLHRDYHPISQPVGTYTYLLNGIRIGSGAIQNELGTIQINGINKKVVGGYVLNTDIVLFLYPSEIGVLDKDDVYHTITTNTDLAFLSTSIVKATGRKNFKGERIIYFTGKGLPIRILNIDNPPVTNFDSITRLIVDALMPNISRLEVTEEGTLPTGIYQFGIRLLTKSTNGTSITPLTNPLSIINEDSLNRDEADGAPPQTLSNKSISLTISNIDTSYEYLELVVFTYLGTANIADTKVITRIPIQGRTTISYLYTSASQFTDQLDTAALIQDVIEYNSAELIEQKDNILFLAGLTSNAYDYNFQEAANKIEIKYVIKEEPWVENLQISNKSDTSTVVMVGNDYKNPLISYEFKSYMREEVYSFAISPIFSNWNVGSAYHIPAPVVLDPFTHTPIIALQSANTITKQLGTYHSSEIYPVGKGFPDDQINRVRHHVMPTLTQEPHIRYANGQTFIRMLGISVDLSLFLGEIPAAVRKNIIGYMIVKQTRDEANKSIISQGIAAGHELMHTGLGDFYIPFSFSGHYPTNNYLQTSGNNPIVDKSLIAFYSPESVIYQSSMSSATRIKPVIQITGDSYLVDKKTASSDNDKYAYVLLNYKDTNNTGPLTTERVITTNETQYMPAGGRATYSTLFVNGLANRAAAFENPGYLLLKLNGNLPADDSLYGDGKGEVYYKFEANATDEIYLNNVISTQGLTQRHLYNLYRPLASQYGAILSAKYHQVKQIMNQDIVDNNFVIQCFNGDTFITKFAVMNSTYTGELDNEYPAVLKGLNYFWVESSINTGYRHYIKGVGNEGDENYVQGTLPYYPKVKLLASSTPSNPGIFDYASELGHPRGYNKQYSFENNLRSFFPTPIEFEPVTSFSNRIIYSEQSVESEQFDAYRVFLPNNYHDIPKEKGKITNLFILNSTLYAHTELSIWQTYVNEQVGVASTRGEFYLGNGGIFYRPSTEVVSVKGGFGGTLSSNGCTTPFGHFFVDQRTKKIFLFNEKLEDLSAQGMDIFFSSINDTDSYYLIYDYSEPNKRLLVTSSAGWTLSYQTDFKSWTSYHSYIPYFFINRGKELYSATQTSFHKHNIGNYTEYYGAYNPLIFEHVVNDEADKTKSFDNIQLYNDTYFNTTPKLYETFTSVQVYNDVKDTSELEIIVPRTFNDEFQPLGINQVFAKQKNLEFRIAVKKDLLQNPEVPGVYVTSPDFRPTMTGKWAKVRWVFNRPNRKFVLHTAKTTVKLVAR